MAPTTGGLEHRSNCCCQVRGQVLDVSKAQTYERDLPVKPSYSSLASLLNLCECSPPNDSHVCSSCEHWDTRGDPSPVTSPSRPMKSHTAHQRLISMIHFVSLRQRFGTSRRHFGHCTSRSGNPLPPNFTLLFQIPHTQRFAEPILQLAITIPNFISPSSPFSAPTYACRGSVGPSDLDSKL
jgi:hypothetical protein